MSSRRQLKQLFSQSEKTAASVTTATKLGLKHYYDHNNSTIRSPSSTTTAFRLFIITVLLFFIFFTTTIKSHFHTKNITIAATPKCPSTILPFYIYTLPPQFNTFLLSHCKSLNIYTNMCPYITNHGLGLSLNSTSWFSTHQFLAEMLFHARAKSHPCRTHNPSLAKLFYIPFYAGLYASSNSRQSNLTLRDSMVHSLESYLLTQQPSWKNSYGHDHFLAIGRTAWDFMRPKPENHVPDYGANILLNHPSFRNVSFLTVERHPWKHHGKQFGIPYPSYFHPRTQTELLTWQNSILLDKNPRQFLFSFIGGTRPGLQKAKIRHTIIHQCRNSTKCHLLDCSGAGKVGRCFNPTKVMKVMLNSEFCLQAPGDSFTRRSTFDSLLAGCVPVFFSKHTAYTQYEWYLPIERREYSVYIDEEKSGVRIEEVLRKITKEKISEMRNVIVRNVLPRVTYMHPDYDGKGVFDAVDVALEKLSRRRLMDLDDRRTVM